MPLWKRRLAIVGAVVVVLLSGLVATRDPLAAGSDSSCSERALVLYAVRDDTGHLSEIQYCRAGTGSFLPAREIAGGDWRQYRDIVAVAQGVIYARTSDGRLLWFRQDPATGQLSAPIQIGGTIDWSRYHGLVSAGAGYLHAIGSDDSAAVHTFRHADWLTGGKAITEGPLLFRRDGHRMTHLRWGYYGEAISGGYHLRLWDKSGDGASDIAYRSGMLPSGVTSVTGGEPILFGVSSTGEVVAMAQRRTEIIDPETGKLRTFRCYRYWPGDWHVETKSFGGYQLVIAARGSANGFDPRLARDPGPGPDCQADLPYEWQ